MEKSSALAIRNRSIAQYFIIAFFVLGLLGPYVYLFLNSDQLNWPHGNDFATSFFSTLTQSTLSSLGSVGLGALGALGLSSLRERLTKNQFRLLKLLCVLPNFLPGLVVALSVFNILTPFPFGLTGVVLIHILLNVGLVSWILEPLFSKVINHWRTVSQLMGSRTFLFWLRVGVPLIYRDLLASFLFVFSISITSFSIPLLAGGQRVLSLEVLIYEYYRIYNDQGAVIALSMIQFLMLLSLSVFWRPKIFFVEQNLHTKSSFANTFWALLPFAPVVIIFYGILSVLPAGLNQLLHHSDFVQDLFEYVSVSLMFSTACGAFALTLFLLFATLSISQKQHRIMAGFLSASFVASALWIKKWIGGDSFYTQSIQFVVGFSFLYFPFLYRLSWGERLQELKGQIQVAATMGARHSHIVTRIIWPQILGQSLKLSGLCAVWAAGDFAYSQLIFSNRFSFAQYLHGLMGSYRLEAATSLTVVLIFICIIVYAVFWGLGYVFHQEP